MEAGRCLAVVRIRGETDLNREIEDVFRQMHLTRKNHATLIRSSPENIGMLQKIKDYSVWGDVSLETIELLLRKRGMLKGNARLTDDYVKLNLNFTSLSELAKKLYEGHVDLWKLDGLKPVFRLHPPRKGFKGSIKKPYPDGEAGYRGKEINNLLKRMA